MQYENSGFGRVLAQHRGRWLVATDDEEKPRLLPARGSLRDKAAARARKESARTLTRQARAAQRAKRARTRG